MTEKSSTPTRPLVSLATLCLVALWLQSAQAKQTSSEWPPANTLEQGLPLADCQALLPQSLRDYINGLGYPLPKNTKHKEVFDYLQAKLAARGYSLAEDAEVIMCEEKKYSVTVLETYIESSDRVVVDRLLQELWDLGVIRRLPKE